MGITYDIKTTRMKLSDIQTQVEYGLIVETVNKNRRKNFFMINSEMLADLLLEVAADNEVVFDKEQNIYTIVNGIIPQFYGEGKSVKAAKKMMFDDTVEFVTEFIDKPELYAGIFSGLQQFIIANLALNIDSELRMKEILHLA